MDVPELASGAERLVIVGSGPAAFTAAVYGARLGLRPRVFEGALTEENRVAGSLPLGQLNYAQRVWNYPGFPDRIWGPELALQFREHATEAGAVVETEGVIRVVLSHRPFELRISDGRELRAETLIIATGAMMRRLDVPGVAQLMNDGISVCLDDAPLPRFRRSPVAVVGGGDSAVEAALFLTRFSDPVYLIHRSDRLRALDLAAVTSLQENAAIRVLWNTEVAGVFGSEDEGLTAVQIRDASSGQERLLNVRGLFPMIGRTPSAAWLEGQLALDARGYVRVGNGSLATATSVPGVFAAGEVADPIYRQAVTAAGQGCQAAMDAFRWLRSDGSDTTEFMESRT